MFETRLAALKSFWSWWVAPGGIAPWFEYNQGAISVLALVGALAAALHQHQAALEAERRSDEKALRAKDAGAREAAEAEITRQITQVSQFASAARGVIIDVEKLLEADRREVRELMVGDVNMPLSAELRAGARAAADTLKALLAAAPADAVLIRATCRGIADLQEIQEFAVMTEKDYEAVFDAWRDDLREAREAITEAQIGLTQTLRPTPTGAPPTHHEHFGSVGTSPSI